MSQYAYDILFVCLVWWLLIAGFFMVDSLWCHYIHGWPLKVRKFILIAFWPITFIVAIPYFIIKPLIKSGW